MDLFKLQYEKEGQTLDRKRASIEPKKLLNRLAHLQMLKEVY